MNSYFFDSSALVKRFARESGTSWLFGLFRQNTSSTIFSARVTHVEVSSALARRAKAGSFDKDAEERYSRRLARLFEFSFLKIELTDELTSEAVRLTRKHFLRGYDAVQLAAALYIERELKASGLSSLIFVSADSELNSAALTEGLTVENPNDHP